MSNDTYIKKLEKAIIDLMLHKAQKNRYPISNKRLLELFMIYYDCIRRLDNDSINQICDKVVKHCSKGS